MKKVASSAVFAALSTAGPTLRKLASENQELARQNRELREELRRERQDVEIRKLAQEMHDRHLDQGLTMDETVKFLMEKAASGKLETFAEAVRLSATRNFLGGPSDVRDAGDPLERAVFGS